MSDPRDIFADHYSLLRRDPAARHRLINDPIAGLKEFFGSVPDGDYRVEVVPQEPDTITIVLPAPPAEGGAKNGAVASRARRRSFGLPARWGKDGIDVGVGDAALIRY